MLNTYYVLVCELDDEYMEVKNLKVLPLTIKIERQFNMNPILHKKKISVLEGPNPTLKKFGKETIFWGNSWNETSLGGNNNYY